MAIMITEDCINCGACEAECPNTAIYEGGVEWAYSDGTEVSGTITLIDGKTVNAEQERPPKDNDIFYIVTDKCTECQGFHEEPQCAAVCPVNCCLPDPNNVESETVLLAKKALLHLE